MNKTGDACVRVREREKWEESEHEKEGREVYARR
jgi:hypothetical protein